MRFVQLTPKGSACSIAFGTGITETAPGSARGLQIVVDDVAQAREELMARGVETGDVQHLAWGDFIGFTDPDGNQWAIQQLPPAERPPPRRSGSRVHRNGASDSSERAVPWNDTHHGADRFRRQ